jgi:hypothetical protein
MARWVTTERELKWAVQDTSDLMARLYDAWRYGEPFVAEGYLAKLVRSRIRRNRAYEGAARLTEE